MSARKALIGAAFLLAACMPSERDLDKALGIERNLVVLEKNPLDLGPKPTVFASATPMRVIGSSAGVCYVLKGGVSGEDSGREYEGLMRGAKVRTEVILADGKRFELHEPMQAWRMEGRVTKEDEVAACASPRCRQPLPVGATIESIEVRAEPALAVKGVYWESEKMPDLGKGAPVQAPASCN